MRVCPTLLYFVTFVHSSQFEGDRDTKRPSDFNARTLEDHEEEDEEDEDHAPARTSKKRTESGSIKPTPASQPRPQQVSPSVPPPPNKRPRIDSIEIPSDATPASSSSTPSLPALLHPSLQPLFAQTLQAHMPSYNPQNSLSHIYSMVQQQQPLPSESTAALLSLLRSAGLQSGRFNSQSQSQNPPLPEGFLASLAEFASANPGIGDSLGNGLSGYGLSTGGGAFDWPTGLGSSSNTQEPQPSTSSSHFLLSSDPFTVALYSPHRLDRGGDDGPNWLDFLTAPPPNPANGLPSLPLHNPQHPHPHPHHPASFLNQRNFSSVPVPGSGYPSSLSPSFGGLSQLNLSRLSGSEDSRSSRRPLPRDNAYSPWNSDASSQSGRSDSSMSMFRPSQNGLNERDRRIELEEAVPGSAGGPRNLLP